MGRKTILKPYKVIDDGDISGDVTSSSTNIEFLDSVTYLVQWTGSTPIGVLYVDVRQKTGGEPDGFNTSWITLEFGETISVSGASGGHTISIENKAFTESRLRFVSTSGSGTMQATISGSVEGA